MIRLTELLNVNFNKVNWTKQSENDKAIIYNIMINGRTGGRIIYDKARKIYIATMENSDNTFQPKSFKSKKDAITYMSSFSVFSNPITVMGGSEEQSYQSYAGT